MSTAISQEYPAEKNGRYTLVLQQAMALMEGERSPLPNMANIAALLNGAMGGINWVGFYLLHHGELVLGPFQGKPACIRIPMGKGVCGTAAGQQKTQLVPDVHTFPGHIACDAASRSEIVVPIMANGSVVAVLDIDSPHAAHFDEEDQAGLEAIAEALAGACDWQTLL